MRMSLKLANGMKMRKGNGNTISLLFSLKGLKISYEKIREHGNTAVGYSDEYFNTNYTSQYLLSFVV